MHIDDDDEVLVIDVLAHIMLDEIDEIDYIDIDDEVDELDGVHVEYERIDDEIDLTELQNDNMLYDTMLLIVDDEDDEHLIVMLENEVNELLKYVIQ